MSKAYRFEQDGWLFLHIEGTPRDRGFQHGFLLAQELSECMEQFRFICRWTTGHDLTYFARHACRLYTQLLDAEFISELEGIVEGAARAGYKLTYPELLAWNANIELLTNWWPTVNNGNAPLEFKAGHHCNSFIASGDGVTRDGGLVLAHNTWDIYLNSNVFRLAVDITPVHGQRILMQSAPGLLHSGTDFFMTSAGLVGSETTIPGFSGYDVKGLPEFYRVRKAMQYADSIDAWVEIMKERNNGGYANSWLLGSIHTGEIARLELGLKNVALTRKSCGYFWGCNVVVDPAIRNQECQGADYSNILQSAGRRIRWEQLLKEYQGKLDIDFGKWALADHYDSYCRKENPGSRTFCAHFDEFNGEFGPLEFGPNEPYGTNDGKVTDSTLAREMSFLGLMGHPCGRIFEVEEYFAKNPQYDWQREYLRSKPSRPWVKLGGGQRPPDASRGDGHP